MPSFLSKVFGRKKDEKDHSNGRDSESSLLEGKFEAVSPTVSPTAAKFVEPAANGHGKEKDKERDFGFKPFKTKSNTASPVTAPKPGNFPHLSLDLPSEPKDETNSRVLGSVFDADPDSQILLAQNIIGKRRLSPSETTNLVRACAQAITARGLETLGIMHPHWYSASPDVQRRLISFFIHSLAPNSPTTTLFPSSSSPQAAFESEVQFTRSPHDIAAVLRWGLRHLQLEGQSFGKNDSWYTDFLVAERAAEYPTDAFTTKLVPLLPSSHADTLKTTLEIMSSLAAHSETNSTSGSKLSKLFGLWLLSIPRVETTDNWASFYARWERSGRMLEHLFLSHIRDQNRTLRMPTRLTELVQRYPYGQPTDNDLLPRPRFSTRSFDSLYIRVETQTLNPLEAKVSFHPLLLVLEAFKADGAAPENGDLWEKIKNAAKKDGADVPQFGQVFADETVRLFSMFPVDKDYAPLLESVLPARKRSISLGAVGSPSKVTSPTTEHARATTDEPKQVTSPTSPSLPTPDWTEFSTAGFLESTDITPLTLSFLDKDVEITRPKKGSKKSKGTSNPGRGRKSLENRPTPQMTEQFKPTSKYTTASIIQVDEAFIDFWNDSLFDSISDDWPTVVLCKLKSTVQGLAVDGKKVEWLVLEQVSVKPPTPATPMKIEASAESSSSRPRASSPRPSFRSDLSGPFSATRKRFSIFTSGRNSRQSMDSVTSPTKAKSSRGKKAAKSPQVGEMGEILAEEAEDAEKIREKEKANAKVEAKKVAEAPKIRVPSPKPKKSLDASKKSLDGNKGAAVGVSLAGAGAVAAGSAAVVAAAVSQDKAEETTEISTPEPVSGPTPPVEEAPVAEAQTATPESIIVPAVEESVVVPGSVVEAPVEAKEPEAPQPEDVDDLPVAEGAQSAPEVEVPASVEEEVADVPAAIPEPLVETETPSSEPAVIEHVPVVEPVTELTPALDAVAEVLEPTVEPTVEEPVPEPVAEATTEVEEPTVPAELEPAAAVADSPEPPLAVEVSSVVDEDTPAEPAVDAVQPPNEPVKEDTPAEPEAPIDAPGSAVLEEVPVVETESIVEDRRASSIQPIHTEAAEPSERSTQDSVASEEVAEETSSLPPAPESIVLAGETPGPQVALSSSEPAALAHVVVPDNEEVPVSSEEVVVDETQEKSTETHPNGNGTAPPPLPIEPVEVPQDPINVAPKEEVVSGGVPHVDETAPISDGKPDESSSADHDGNGVAEESAQS